jgi:hypothetical protein
MKLSSTLFVALVVLIMTSCNNKPKEEAATPAPAKTTSLQPYKARMVQFTVEDYDAWYPAYVAHDSDRKAVGLTESSVGRGLDDDKWVTVFSMASDIQKAKDFDASPGMKAAMEKAGVTGPTFTYLNVLRDDTSTIPQHERLMVTHHVKDFDTWLKAYDGEGMATRAANGMVDRAMARSIDDPNTVTLLFAITDMTKAKARANSEELKKIMTDAGVDGPPTMTYFKWVTN